MLLSGMGRRLGGADFEGEDLDKGFGHDEFKIYTGHQRENVE